MKATSRNFLLNLELTDLALITRPLVKLVKDSEIGPWAGFIVQRLNVWPLNITVERKVIQHTVNTPENVN